LPRLQKALNIAYDHINPPKFATMGLEIIHEPFRLDIYGFSGIAINRDYAGTAFKLMDKMWQTVKSNNLKNQGLNIWVYEQDHCVFAGVELNDIPNRDTGLEHKNITLFKYAYYKHIGAYNLIKQAAQNMTGELERRGYETMLPYIEIYGHWTNDEAKLETGLMISLK
jgi:predicted transcriptional regulator YdeE